MALTWLFIFYCFEAGVFFIIAPWTRFWTMNPLLHMTPALGVLADNFYVRGFVTGFGLVHLLLGLREIAGLIMRKKERDQAR